MDCYWSCLVRSWSLRNRENLGAKRIWRRSGIVWTSDESSGIPRRVGRWWTCVAILDGVIFWSIQMSPALSLVGACGWEVARSKLAGILFNALSSWYSSAEEDLNHKCESSGFNCRLCNCGQLSYRPARFLWGRIICLFDFRKHNDCEVGFRVLTVTIDLLLIHFTENLRTWTYFSEIENFNWRQFNFSSIYK